MLTPEQKAQMRRLQTKVVKLETLANNAHQRSLGPVGDNVRIQLRLAARKLEEEVNKARSDLYLLEVLGTP